MAYLNFDPVAGGAPVRTFDAPPAQDGFSPLEWTVIALARRDRIASLSEPSRTARALGGLFGRGVDSRLADPRLEALRRFAVHAWHRGYVLPVSEIKRFVASGFSVDQAETLLGSVVDHHVAAGERVPA